MTLQKGESVHISLGSRKKGYGRIQEQPFNIGMSAPQYPKNSPASTTLKYTNHQIVLLLDQSLYLQVASTHISKLFTQKPPATLTICSSPARAVPYTGNQHITRPLQKCSLMHYSLELYARPLLRPH